MIYLRWQTNDHAWSRDEWSTATEALPPAYVRQLARYRRWQDRQAAVLGRLLLLRVAGDVLGRRPVLDRLRTDEFRRPYFPAAEDFDFNISHTDGLVACCGAVGIGRVGVDVERIGTVDVAEFQRVFTAREYERLTALDDPTTEFYHLWTRKEAVMKADGRGFYLDAGGIDCLRDPVRIDAVAYRVVPVGLRDGYACHVAGPADFSWDLSSCAPAQNEGWG